MPTHLPYGPVMASAGASVLAARCGLHALVVPLLVVALLQAVLLPAIGGRSGGRVRYAPPASHPRGSLGWTIGGHTVPLGLAVIASGLAMVSVASSFAWIFSAAEVVLAVAWVSSFVCGAWFIRHLLVRGVALSDVDGAWFLVPAAPLGAALATMAVAARLEEPSALEVAAWGGALAGWFGYWAIAVVAVYRVRRFGLGETPRSTWWIAMGCAGLAAATLAQLLVNVVSRAPWLAWIVAAAMNVVVLSALVLIVPVLVLSMRFLACRCRFRGAAAWPPTFSTAVLALGCLDAGAILKMPLLEMLGRGAGYATVVFWVATISWNTGRWLWLRVGARSRAVGAKVE